MMAITKLVLLELHWYEASCCKLLGCCSSDIQLVDRRFKHLIHGERTVYSFLCEDVQLRCLHGNGRKDRLDFSGLGFRGLGC